MKRWSVVGYRINAIGFHRTALIIVSASRQKNGRQKNGGQENGGQENGGQENGRQENKRSHFSVCHFSVCWVVMAGTRIKATYNHQPPNIFVKTIS